jgi:hypothetical protein
MNNYIIPADQSSHPNVSIEIFDSDLNLVDTVQDLNVDGDGRRVVYIDDFTKDKDAAFGQDEKMTNAYILKLKLDDDIMDLQYIMDVKVSPELDDDELQKLTGSEARMQARFTSSTRGCNDYRAHGRGRDGGLSLELVVPSSVFKLSDIGDHGVDLVAGWACGHEGVTLTQSIVFLPRRASGGTISKEAGTRIEVNSPELLEEDINNIVEDAPLAEDTPNDTHDDDRAGDKLAETISHRHRAGAEHSMPAEKKDTKEDQGRTTMRRNIKPKKHGNKEEQEDSLIRKFKSKYDADDFGKASFTANSYLAGIVVFVIVGGTIINAFVAMSGRNRSSRSKRDL